MIPTPSHAYIPPPAEAVQLSVDDLAVRLLGLIHEAGQGHLLTRGNVGVPGNWEHHAPGAATDESFLMAVSEAYDWLAVNGLVAVRPGNETGWGYVTKRGLRILAEAEPAATARAESRLGVDLHRSIGAEVRHQFLVGNYDVAVFIAFREVESRIRDLAGFDNADHRLPMITNAFNPTKPGPLADPATTRSEQVAMMEFFRGPFGVFRNETGHRRVDYGSAILASEVVMTADLQLRMLDRIAGRLGKA